jgi:hypothetical protein
MRVLATASHSLLPTRISIDRSQTMSSFWVRAEETYGCNESWHGPFDDFERAALAAVRLSTAIGAEDKFAELVHRQKGGEGTRIREYYLGREYETGESGWYERTPPVAVAIPKDAGRGRDPSRSA